MLKIQQKYYFFWIATEVLAFRSCKAIVSHGLFFNFSIFNESQNVTQTTKLSTKLYKTNAVRLVKYFNLQVFRFVELINTRFIVSSCMASRGTFVVDFSALNL